MVVDPRGQLLETTRGRIATLLRRGGSTVDEIASELQLSPNAVRVQLTRMERDGLVRRTRLVRRKTRPSRVYELTPASEQLISRAYLPFLAEVVRVTATRHSTRAFRSLMRQAGRALAENYRSKTVAAPSLAARVAAASAVLNDEFGALTRVERENGQLVIRGHGCPLAAITGGNPAVCVAIESLVAELIGRQVRECCTRQQPPQCCFRVQTRQ